MKHASLPSATFCRIYGHSDMRWRPLVGPSPLPIYEADRPRVLVCLRCTTIVECST